MEMRSKARRLAAQHQGLDLIVVDYLQLMQGHPGAHSENRVQEVSEISRSLKALARELKVPVLALSQLSRSVESRQSRVPQLSDLRESGCLAGETLIYLPDEGISRRIDQLVGKSGFNVLALNPETWKLEPRPVARAFSTGRKPVYRLRTQLGRSVRATANHQFLTIEGWRRLDELLPGMQLALPRSLPGPAIPTMSKTERQFQAAPGMSYCGATLYKSTMSRERAARVAHVVRSEALTRLAVSDVYWDEVVAIEPDGEEEVYDLTVDGLHNFVANTIVVHNSIEQDSDIVLFIYRDEMYNPDSDRKNTADIIVAKHRNGPTGQFSLRFDANKTLFQNLATHI
jgi:replicative DNA helicase